MTLLAYPLAVTSSFMGTMCPDEEVSVGNWEDESGSACSGAGTDCAVVVADSDDATYVQTEEITQAICGISPETRNIRWGFTNPSPKPTGAEVIIIKVRARYSSGAAGPQATLDVDLYELANLEHSFAAENLTSSWVTYLFTVPESVKNNIADWDDVRVDCSTTVCTTAGGAIRTQIAEVWIEFDGGAGGCVQPPEGDYPDEPSGSTVLTEHNMSTLPGAGWSGGPTSDMYVVTDSGDPRTPSGAVEHFMEAQTIGPTSTLKGTKHIFNYTNRQKVYWYITQKVSNPFTWGPGGTTKICWPRLMDFFNDTNHYVALDGSGRLVFQKQGTHSEDPETFRRYRYDDADNEVSPTEAQATFPKGSWVEWWFILRCNTTSSPPHNGEVHFWRDGVKILQFTEEWITPSAGAALDQLLKHYFWGGLNSTLPQDQNWRIGHIYGSYH